MSRNEAAQTQRWIKLYNRALRPGSSLMKVSEANRWRFLVYVLHARWHKPFRGCLCDEDGRPWSREERARLLGLKYDTVKHAEEEMLRAGLITFQRAGGHPDAVGRLHIANYARYQGGGGEAAEDPPANGGIPSNERRDNPPANGGIPSNERRDNPPASGGIPSNERRDNPPANGGIPSNERRDNPPASGGIPSNERRDNPPASGGIPSNERRDNPPASGGMTLQPTEGLNSEGDPPVTGGANTETPRETRARERSTFCDDPSVGGGSLARARGSRKRLEERQEERLEQRLEERPEEEDDARTGVLKYSADAISLPSSSSENDNEHNGNGNGVVHTPSSELRLRMKYEPLETLLREVHPGWTDQRLHVWIVRLARAVEDPHTPIDLPRVIELLGTMPPSEADRTDTWLRRALVHVRTTTDAEATERADSLRRAALGLMRQMLQEWPENDALAIVSDQFGEETASWAFQQCATQEALRG